MLVAEPKISESRADEAISDLDFHNSIKIEALGFSGGLWAL